ncbi:Hsp20/alpha crystallin family protein [Chryseolinea sp. H1M3-3]|uniref:Hsp20/alpha crystallin family protein n=1 Tax=Chryseolinea sp. H1M3-3 TaxID=3034144 RepID=UPI0023ED95F9|nr:Hsp20/alpha crystallin family protein [Chryseolinea sp. H1M3-3]
MKNLVRTNGNSFSSIPSLLNDFFTDDWFNSSLANWRPAGATLPAVNVMETNEDFRIEVAAPGMKRDDFKVELDNNLLVISSELEDSKEEVDKNGKYTRKEFSYQSFQRSFSLPENKVEGGKITAKYSDGILHVTVPKKEEAKVKPARQITVG